MTPEQREAHERLTNSLPARVHLGCAMKPTHKARKGRGKKALIIDGMRYESLYEAAQALKITTSTVHHHLRRNRPGWGYA